LVAAGRSPQEQIVGQPLELLLRGGPPDVVGQRQEAGKDADDVAVEDGERVAERERGDGGDRVWPEPGQGGQGGGIGREFAAMVADEEFCRFMDLAGAGVVAEAFPKLEDVLQRGGGEGGGIGKPGHKPPEIGHDGVHPGLLEHDFRNPDGVRPARLRAPGQVARFRANHGSSFRRTAARNGWIRDEDIKAHDSRVRTAGQAGAECVVRGGRGSL
jgi:hypothetical protein